MAGSHGAYRKETKVNYLSAASHSVSFVDKIKSKREKEMSDLFLSFFLSFLPPFSLSLILYPPQ
jgi:hypothetical protein